MTPTASAADNMMNHHRSGGQLLQQGASVAALPLLSRTLVVHDAVGMVSGEEYSEASVADVGQRASTVACTWSDVTMPGTSGARDVRKDGSVEVIGRRRSGRCRPR